MEVFWVLVGVGGCWLVVRWREKTNASEIAMRRIFFFQSRIIGGIGHWIDSFQRHSQQQGLPINFQNPLTCLNLQHHFTFYFYLKFNMFDVGILTNETFAIHFVYLKI